MTRDEVLRALKEHLRTAIELEHATLPPYLSVLWSIHGTSPDAERAAKLIRSVIHEEMLHLAMACNILNAIGGTPRLNDPERLPRYPCALPGHSLTVNSFIVHLDKCCPRAMGDFMRIELPSSMATERRTGDGWSTIGEFYDTIESLIKHEALTDSDFVHGRQIMPGYRPGRPGHGVLHTVNSRQTALQALDEIIDQGEGHDAGLYDRDHELTHYWKFTSVRDLMTHCIWHYERDVLDMAMDPDPKYFTPEARELDHRVNAAYSAMLDAMQAAVTSEVPRLEEAIAIMYQMKEPAMALMRIPLVGRTGNAGPTFRYIAQGER